MDNFGLFENDISVFKELLFADTVRGAHGTGIFYQGHKKESLSIKGPIPGPSFLKDSKVIDSLTEAKKHSQILIGHNRHATKGSINYECSHPFMEEHITLVHNGTLYNHKAIADTEVDSNAIAVSIAKIGAKETLKLLDGAFALIWHDTKEHTLNVVRNSERPLHYIKTKSQYIIASEASMLEWICSRNKITFEKAMPFLVKNLYKFNLKTKELSIEPVEFKEKEYTSFTGGHYYYNGKYYPNTNKGYYASGEFEKDLVNKEKQMEKKESEKQTKKKELTVYEPKADNNGMSLRHIGEKVYFSPIDVVAFGNTYVLNCLIEELEPNLYSDSMEVKLYNKDFASLNNLLNYPLLDGIVSHIGRSGSGDMWYVIRNIGIVTDVFDGTSSMVN